MLKAQLKIWNKTTFGNVHYHVKKASDSLDNIQSCLNDKGPTATLLNKEKQGEIDIENDLTMDEMFWHEKTIIRWHKDGYMNIYFFHKLATMKEAYKNMASSRI